MPLAVGGGIRSVDDVRALLGVGADKVVIGTAALRTPDVVREAADRFGSQCVVVSIDCRGGEVCTKSGQVPTGRDPVDVAQRVEELGAGEILLQSIDEDGVMEGYDVDDGGARERRGVDSGDRLRRRRARSRTWPT